jgi:hypothetical protein
MPTADSIRLDQTWATLRAVAELQRAIVSAFAFVARAIWSNDVSTDVHCPHIPTRYDTLEVTTSPRRSCFNQALTALMSPQPCQRSSVEATDPTLRFICSNFVGRPRFTSWPESAGLAEPCSASCGARCGPHRLFSSSQARISSGSYQAFPPTSTYRGPRALCAKWARAAEFRNCGNWRGTAARSRKPCSVGVS